MKKSFFITMLALTSLLLGCTATEYNLDGKIYYSSLEQSVNNYYFFKIVFAGNKAITYTIDVDDMKENYLTTDTMEKLGVNLYKIYNDDFMDTLKVYKDSIVLVVDNITLTEKRPL